MSTNLYTYILGRNVSKKKKVDTRVLIMQILNSVPTISRLDRLKFCFNLYDEDDARIISHMDLKKIL